MTRRKIVGISLPPELEAAAKAHVAALVLAEIAASENAAASAAETASGAA